MWILLKFQTFVFFISWLIGKDPDPGKDWRQEKKGMTGYLISCLHCRQIFFTIWATREAISSVQFSSVAQSQHARPPCPSPTPGVHSNSCPSSWWCHPAISSSVVPFSSCPQSLPASQSFPMSQLFAWGVNFELEREEKKDLMSESAFSLT